MYKRQTLDNVIPGVAIATALMPPLCTAGYGLANGNWQYFIGAGYLFFINAFFIFFAAFIVLKGVYSLPFHKQAEEVNRRNPVSYTHLTEGFKPFTREYTLCTKKIKLNALT